jgi:hypothetical protein
MSLPVEPRYIFRCILIVVQLYAFALGGFARAHTCHILLNVGESGEGASRMSGGVSE